MPRLLLAFLPGLWALREDLEAISLASKVPRNCDVGGSALAPGREGLLRPESSTCCACGKVIRKSPAAPSLGVPFSPRLEAERMDGERVG